MRVLQVITRGELGGAQRYVAELARRQTQAGFDVELATGSLGWLTDQPGCFSEIHQLPHLVRDIDPRRDSRALVTLVRFLRERRYDVVHTHVSKAGFVGRIAAALADVPLVAHTSHGFILTESISSARRAVYWMAEQLAAAVTDRFFAISETDRAVLQRSLRTRAGALRVMTIIPTYIREMRPAWTFREDRRWDLVAIGNLYFNKGYDVLLPAVAELAKTYPRLQLTVYGEGPERDRLATTISQLDLADRVHLRGRTTDVAHHVARAGIFVMPSRKEGLPLALLEAMATGAPIVTTEVGAVREVLGNRTPLARPERPDDLIRLIDHMLSSDAHRISSGAAARSAFERLLPADDPSAISVMYA